MKQTALTVTPVVIMLTAYQCEAQDFSNGIWVVKRTAFPFTVTDGNVTTIFFGSNRDELHQIFPSQSGYTRWLDLLTWPAKNIY